MIDRMGQISDELSSIEKEGLLRFLHTLPAVGGRLDWDGREILNFSSNDYLNLAGDERLKRAAKRAVDQYGCGATASRLMAGHLVLHEELEEHLAGLVREEAALVFSSGYQANLGVITTLAHRGETIFSDALNHASIVDGCRLSGARINIYRHCDMDHLESLLSANGTSGRKIIVSDSVFSVDGDLAPVEKLTELARRFHALLIIDEAHAIGVMGDGGGLCRERGVHPDVIVGTMSKALGSGGGFAAGSENFYALLVNRARSFIFSTGLAPACLGSAIAAIGIIRETQSLGCELLAKAAHFRELLRDRGFEVPDSPSQVIPIIIGDNQAAVDLSHKLLDDRLLVTAIRPPTVPDGTARLRLSVTLAHTEEDFTHAADVLAETGLVLGVL